MFISLKKAKGIVSFFLHELKKKFFLNELYIKITLVTVFSQFFVYLKSFAS